MMRESVQLGAWVEADAVLLREAKRQRRPGGAVPAQARSRRLRVSTAPTHDSRGI
jgi:hypothetical protein